MKKLFLLFSLMVLTTASVQVVDGPPKLPLNAGGGGSTGVFPSDSITLNWKFNGDVTDSSGNGNNGTTHGTVAYVADETGATTHALVFDGTTTFVDAASPSVANFTSGDFSVVSWYTNTAPNFDASPVVFGNAQFGSPGYFFQIHLAAGGDNLAAAPRFGWNDGGGDHTILSTDRSMSSISLEYCIVFVRSGTSGKIYVNGTDVTAASQPTIGTITSNTANNFTVGKYLGGGQFVIGNIQQLIVYSRALTPTEVATGSAGTSQ